LNLPYSEIQERHRLGILGDGTKKILRKKEEFFLLLGLGICANVIFSLFCDLLLIGEMYLQG
jgi:hypothetical protein